jgi:hypothetical protein
MLGIRPRDERGRTPEVDRAVSDKRGAGTPMTVTSLSRNSRKTGPARPPEFLTLYWRHAVPFALSRNSRKTGPAWPPEFLTLFGGTLCPLRF